MPALQNIRMLTRYTAWANTRLFEAIAGTQAPAGVEAMVTTLNHAYVVDLIWKAHLEGLPHGFTSRNTDTQPQAQALRQMQARIDDWYIHYADGLSEATLDEVVHFQFVDGGAGAMARGDMLLHVVNHKTYHRGYVAQMLYQAALRPPTLDLPVFLRDVPPA
jgi:uncharacterized damage-inducible protein DinB